ncbi:MAG: tetratricopeptide repeat protein, partial [Gemmatimonadota bacterium]
MLKRFLPAFAVLALVPGVLAGQTGNVAVIVAQPTSYSEILPSCEVLRGGHFKVKSGATYLKSALESATNRDRLLNDGKRVLLEAISDDGQAESPAAWYWLGRIYLYQGDVAAADSALDKAEQLAPACGDDLHKARVATYAALIRPAATLLQEGKTDSALVLLQQAAAFYPESPYAYQNLAIIYFNRKQLDSAAANFEKAVASSESKAA